jgi:hypothetical protein
MPAKSLLAGSSTRRSARIRPQTPTNSQQGVLRHGMPKPRNRVHDSPGCKITNPLWLPSGVGIQLQVSMELLIIELGLSAQPLQESFKKYGTRVTHSWVKSIWEKVFRYKVSIELGPLMINPPGIETVGSCKRWRRQALPSRTNSTG